MKKRSKQTAKNSPVSKSPRKQVSIKAQGVLPDDHLRVIFTEKQIEKRVRELAAQVNRDFQGKTLHVIGIMENCFLFMADLVRHLKIPVICYFLRAETKDDSSGKVAVREIVYTPRVDVAGKDVLLVDGILNSGVTTDHLVRLLQAQKVNSINIAEFIEKTVELKVDLTARYVGFKTREKFLVGYGLGFHNRYRNLPWVASLS